MIRREIPVFLVVGALAVLSDFTVYRFLTWAGVMVHLAKAIGFLSGTAFAYFANRLWTFSHTQPTQGSGWRFILLYASTLTVNVQLNALVLNAFAGEKATIPLAFLTATATSAALNFLGLKFFVFRSPHIPETI